MREIIPIVIGRLLALTCAERVVSSLAIEVLAIRARVIEYSVKHNLNSAIVCLVQQPLELLFRAKQLVNGKIITRVVSMI